MDAKITLTTEQCNIIKSILDESLNPSDKVFIFGSRTTGKAKPYSDIDLAIDLHKQTILSLDILSELEDKFEDSALPYKVDIVDLNNVSDNFKNAISHQAILI